ncbi:glycosyltransferase [Pontibacter kalidii]|uniref:glycosyltransferase n=1 Tax=Pontibacter kalidii TaxID=2592049 RepID=UPI00224E20E1|nr:glycosyltransferase [Pontibacter kalidii]
MKPLTISIIIPTYHDWNRLSLCLQALERQSYPKEFIEIIVVNNASDDQIPEWLDIPDNCRIIVEKERGSYAARNTGIKLSEGEILAFTDSDCIPDINWIENAIRYFKEGPGIHRIGGRVELFYQTDKPNLAEAYETIYAFRQDLYVKDGGAVTANMISRRNVFEEVGLFNSNMYSGGDNEWGQRATAKGFNIVYAPEVIVKHPARNKVRDLVRKARRISSGLSQKRKSKVSTHFKKLVRLIFLPPFGELKNIFSNRYAITSWKKIAVFSLRYYILLVINVENIKFHYGAKPFTDTI